MSSVSVVVIIVVVVIVVAARAFLAGRPQPATPGPDPERVPRYEPDPSELAFPLVPHIDLVDPDRIVLPEEDHEVDPEEGEVDPEEGEPDDLSATQRLRSTVLLTLTVIVLGTSAAGLLGAVALVGYRVLDRALG